MSSNMDPAAQLLLVVSVAIALVIFRRVVLVVGAVCVLTVVLMGLLGLAGLLSGTS